MAGERAEAAFDCSIYGDAFAIWREYLDRPDPEMIFFASITFRKEVTFQVTAANHREPTQIASTMTFRLHSDRGALYVPSLYTVVAATKMPGAITIRTAEVIFGVDETTVRTFKLYPTKETAIMATLATM
jgi:hypothetical protein